MKTLNFILFVLLVLISPVFAFAEGETVTPVASALVSFLSNVVFPLLGAVVLALLTMALRWAGKKWKIEALQKDQDWLRSVAYSAMAYVEELAAKQIKSKQVSISSNQKLELAVSKVLESAPKITREKAEELVEAALAMSKGAGATGEQAL